MSKVCWSLRELKLVFSKGLLPYLDVVRVDDSDVVGLVGVARHVFFRVTITRSCRSLTPQWFSQYQALTTPVIGKNLKAKNKKKKKGNKNENKAFTELRSTPTILYLFYTKKTANDPLLH